MEFVCGLNSLFSLLPCVDYEVFGVNGTPPGGHTYSSETIVIEKYHSNSSCTC